jgi:hypothetical protein
MKPPNPMTAAHAAVVNFLILAIIISPVITGRNRPDPWIRHYQPADLKPTTIEKTGRCENSKKTGPCIKDES